MKAGGFLAGRPEDIIEALKAVEKRYPGLDRVICAPPRGTPLDVQLEDLDRFAKEVIPAFRDTRTLEPERGNAAKPSFGQRTHLAKASAIGGLPVPAAAITLPRPVSPCFCHPELRNPNRLHLISFRLARTRGRSPFEPMRVAPPQRVWRAARASAER